MSGERERERGGGQDLPSAAHLGTLKVEKLTVPDGSVEEDGEMEEAPSAAGMG